MTRTEALEEVARAARVVWRHFDAAEDADGMLFACRSLGSALAALDRETNPPASSPASPECRHERTRVDCANGETDATCLDCGAVWLDDGQGWRAATAQEGSDGT